MTTFDHQVFNFTSKSLPGGQKVDSKFFNYITPYVVKLSMWSGGLKNCQFYLLKRQLRGG